MHLRRALASCALLLACSESRPEPTPDQPRSSWTGPSSREAWLLAALEAHDAPLAPADRAAKYCKMAESPYAFFRGTTHLFWHDLVGDPRMAEFGARASTRTFVVGDLHAANFGSFADDSGTIVYDLNDFDEVVIADYQWDLWRMATSLVLIAEANGGFSSAEVEGFVDAFAERYLDTLASYRGNDAELAQRFTATNTYGLLDDFLREVAADESRAELLDEWTLVQAGARVFDANHPELAAPDPSVATQLQASWPSYVATTAGPLATTPGYFTIKDLARRLDAGIGSLGTARYYVLIEGPSASDSDDRILDVKRVPAPSSFAYLSDAERSLLDALTLDPAARSVLGQRALLRDADDHLGWLALADGAYAVRERSPFKAAFDTGELTSTTRFTKLAEQWGAIVATAHARADKDARPDLLPHSLDKEIDLITQGEHDELRAIVREVAFEYAEQVALDFAAFEPHASDYGC